MRSRLLLATLLVFGACVEQAEAVLVRADYVKAVNDSVQDTTDLAWNVQYTVTAGAELLACAVIMQENPNITGGGANVGEVATFTYAGATLTRAVQSPISDTNIRVEWWYKVSPATGANALAGTLDAKTDSATVHCLTVSGGIDLAMPIGGVGSNQAADVNWTVAITAPAATSLLFAAGGGKGDDLDPFTPVSGTEIADGDSGGGSTFVDHAYWIAERAGASPLAATATLANFWDMAALEVRETVAAGGGSLARMVALTTVGAGGGAKGVAAPPSPACTVEMAPGSTSAQINTALATALDGSTICLQQNEVIPVAATVVMDCTARSLTLDMRDSIFQGIGDRVVFQARGAVQNVTNVTAKATVGGNAVLTLQGGVPADWGPGDWIKIVADNQLPNAEADRRVGEAMQFSAKTGNDLTLIGTPRYYNVYATTIRVGKIASRNCIVRDGGIFGDANLLAANTLNTTVAQNLVGALFERLHIQDGPAGGFGFFNAVSSTVRDTDCRGVGDGALNVECFHDRSGKGNQFLGVFCGGPLTRHCTDGHASVPGAAGLLQNYGGNFDQHVSNTLCTGLGNSCYVGHTGQRFNVVEDSLAIDTFRAIGARGQNSIYRRIGGNGITNAIQVSVAALAGTGDGSNHLFDRLWMTEVTGACVGAGNADSTGNIVRDSIFRADGACTVGNSTNDGSTFNANVPIPSADTYTGAPYVKAGQQTIMAGGGNDTVNVSAVTGDKAISAGAGIDTITLGAAKASIIVFRVTDTATVVGFKAGGADVIDVSPWIANNLRADYDGNPFPSGDGFVRSNQNGADCQIQIDETGGNNSYVTVLTLSAVTCANLVIADNWKTRLRP